MGGAEQVGASSCRSRRETGAASSQEVGGCSAGMSPVVVADGWESQRADGFTESLRKRGPKPKKGPRQRRLTEWANCSDTPWDQVEVPWYGGRCKLIQVLSRTGLWHRRGCDPVAIRDVLARDPEGKQPDAAYFCTDGRFGPEEILRHVVPRWSLEVTFEEARAHLGLETQRQWSDRAIARTTPVLLGLF